jgi:hypothetical protein
MLDFLKSGVATDIVLIFMLFEAIIVTIFLRNLGQHAAVPGFLATLLAGAFLVIALHKALNGSSIGDINIYLLLSMVSHLVDLTLKYVVARQIQIRDTKRK